MANIYKNAGFAISTTDLTTIYTVPTGRTTIIKNIQITNEHGSNNLVEVFVTDSSASATFEVYHKSLASGETINDAVVDRVVLDLRRKAYGSYESQLEKIYDDGIDSWKLDGAAVKAKFPK